MSALRNLVLLVCLAATAACQTPMPGDGATPEDPLHGIIASGVLRVGLSADQPPFNMRTRSDEIVGFDVDLAVALASAMGLEATIVPMAFAELLPSLETHKIDIVISAMTITPQRNAHVPFAGPYYVSGTSALTKSDELAHIAEMGELNASGRRYAAVAGSTNETFAKEQLPLATLVSTRDFDEAVLLVLNDKVDAVLADFPLCRYAAMVHPEAGFSDLMTPFTVEPLGIAIRADAPLLVNLIDNYLDTLEYAGILGQFKARWLGDDDWLESMP